MIDRSHRAPTLLVAHTHCVLLLFGELIALLLQMTICFINSTRSSDQVYENVSSDVCLHTVLTKNHHGISDGSKGALKYMSMASMICTFYNAYQKHHGISDNCKGALNMCVQKKMNMCDPTLNALVTLVSYINMLKSSFAKN